jgi:hypothetical protein
MRSKPHEKEVDMPANAEAAQSKALASLVEILEDKNVKVEVRVEAAKLILNRPRFFIGPDTTEV